MENCTDIQNIWLYTLTNGKPIRREITVEMCRMVKLTSEALSDKVIVT